MTLTAIILITISAFAHAYWNFLGKRRDPSVAFFLIAYLSAALCLSPLLIHFRHALLIIPPAVWLLVGTTGLFQTIYFTGLAGAYRQGDMSLAYPLARAVPVLFVTSLNLAFGKGHQIGTLGIVGMSLVSLGCLILPLQRFRGIRLQSYLSACALFALVAAVGTTGYTLIDDEALRQLRTMPGIALSNTEITLLFITLEATSITIVLGVYTFFQPAERRILAKLWRTQKYYAGLTGLIIVASYGLVLISMAYVTNVSYVTAFRQFSIPLGAILGMTIQKEPRYRPKLTGIAIVFSGLVMVGLG